jgi:predicted amidohydrolase
MLSDLFLKSFKKIYRGASDKHSLDEVKRVVNNECDNNLLCLSLFKGLADYLTIYRKGTLNLLEQIKIDGLIVTPKPPNPIYEALQNPVREHYGTSFHDLTDIFKYISVIKETNLKINLVKSEKLKRACSYMKLRVKKGFKIAVTPFLNHMTFNIDSLFDNWPENEKTPYWFRKIENIKEAKTWLIEEILKPCIEREVDILVLPELSIDEQLLIFLKNWLKLNNRERVSSRKPGLLLVAAGSFHFESKTDKRLNTSTILNHSGDILWTQNKIKRFSFDTNDIQKKPEIQTLLKTSPVGGYEYINETDTICCADTPIGRISVSICIDFFHKEHLEVYRQTKTNIFLVPAMTYQNIRFLQTAGIFARDNLASSFISNNGYIAKKEKSGINMKGASFYFLPRTMEPGIMAKEENGNLLIFDVGKLIKS